MSGFYFSQSNPFEDKTDHRFFPHPPQKLSENRKKLIDTFILVSDYEKSLKKLIKKEIFSDQENKKYASSELDKIINNFTLQKLTFSLYNDFEEYSDKEINELINLYISKKITPGNETFFMNSDVLTDIKGYIKQSLSRIETLD